MTEKKEENKLTGLEIAVIGMAGRFPGAANLHEYWENLKNGVESISFFTDEELQKAGLDPQMIQNPSYVKANGMLEDKEYFDASFFGYSPREAEVMDPQLRIFHECCWHALEDAGYDPFSYSGAIGVYAGAAASFEWQALSVISGKGDSFGTFASVLLNNSNLLSTRISHKLNLRGPSFSLFTACSTSLVAIHLATRALITGECSMALAGGVAITAKRTGGYLYQEGIIFSPDGHCRAFDAKSQGTVFGEGIGIVVLKRAKEAAADRDNIYALIKGTGINNDGMSKVEYTAPSVKGEVSVIRKVQKLARMAPGSISYVETHGTGTKLGDPIEISALTKAFNTDKKNYCAIGSVKTNIGHLDIAAGAASFIKTVLALKHRLIPPSLNFETPNPAIDFENSPFYVNREPLPWKNEKYPLRAGVSAFGIGGTNAHVILEEARAETPDKVPKAETSRPYQLIILSAKTPSTLDKMTENLAAYFKNTLLNHGNHENPVNPGLTLADAAYTLQVGRKAFQYRRMLVAREIEEAIEILSSHQPANIRSAHAKNEDLKVVFMFPGQGAQYGNMGLELYKTEPVFREAMDRCFEILTPLLGYDIKGVLYPSDQSDQSDRSDQSERSDILINQTEIAQPLLFIFEYALAKLLMEWGIKPHAMIGHSIGEYVAAHAAGVFSLADALKLVALRGQLMQQMPGGSMLGVSISEEALIPLLNEETSLAAVNSPCNCVISGTHDAVAVLENQLQQRRYETRPLHTSHAFHSKMMDPILREFEEKVNQVRANQPQIPYISNLTGKQVTFAHLKSPGYWSNHLRQTVRFSPGVEELLKEENLVFIEVGPGKSLSTFIKQFKDRKPAPIALNLVRHPRENVTDERYLLDKIGQLWLYGKKIDWSNLYSREKRYRVSLPAYPFEGQEYWINRDVLHASAGKLPGNTLYRKPDMGDWFYIPLWEQSAVTAEAPVGTGAVEPCHWLIFVDKYGIGERLAQQLKDDKRSITVTCVETGTGFSGRGDGSYVIAPGSARDYETLFKKLQELDRIPQRIVHLCSVTKNNEKGLSVEVFENSQAAGFYSLLSIVRAVGKQNITDELQIAVITNNMQEIAGEGEVCPEKATILGAVKVIPLEYSNISCRSIDILIPPPGTLQEEILSQLLWEELMSDSREIVVVLRGKHRWVQRFKPVRFDKPQGISRHLEKGGVYLVTGGLGGIGFSLAQFLAKTVKAKLILTGRSPFPSRDEWGQWLNAHDEKDDTALIIRKVREFEDQGAEIMIVNADVTDKERMQEVITRVRERFGKLNGVLHAAGVIDYEGVIQRRTLEATKNSMAAKVKGTLVLNEILKDGNLDFFVLFSTVGNIVYRDKFGQVGYTAANEFLEAFASYKAGKDCRGPYTLTINWPDWLEVGMVVAALNKMHKGNQEKIEADIRSFTDFAVSPAEGIEIFSRIMDRSYPQVSVSPKDLEIMIQQMNLRLKSQKEAGFRLSGTLEEPPSGESLYQRPRLTTRYVAPSNEIEQKLAVIFQRFLGIDQLGVHDDFFELGGNSLTATGLLAIIHKELDVKIPLVELFNNPTIKGLMPYIMGSEKARYLDIQPVEEKKYYSLSSAQKRLYIIQQMDLESTAYNISQTVVLEGRLAKEKLEEIFNKLIKKHDILRTSFEMIEGEPMQNIHDEVEFEIEYYDLQVTDASDRCRWKEVPIGQINACSGKEGESATRNSQPATALISSFIRPFDLSHAPLLRVVLIHTPRPKSHPSQEWNSENRHILMVDMHHIISDGVSHSILIQDFMDLYAGKELSPLRLQYKDYSQWQNCESQREKLKKQGKYWLKEFELAIPVLNLPTDYIRPGVQSFEGSRVAFTISEEAAKALNALALGEDTTLYMVLISIYYVLLYKLSGQEDIVIGAPTAGRIHADIRNIIGVFLNMLSLKSFLEGKKIFLDFLKEVKAKVMEAFENQEYPFEDLVDQLEVKRDTGRNPLFDVMFILQNQEVPEIEIPGLTLKPFDYVDNTSKFDLSLYAVEAERKLHFTVNFSTKLFKRATIEIFIKYFKNIVSSVLKNPCTEISNLDVMSGEEISTILENMNRNLKEEAEPIMAGKKVFQDKLNESLIKFKKNIAIEYGIRAITYEELDKRSNYIANWLVNKGIKKETFIGILIDDRMELINTIIGILKAGCVFIPLDSFYPDRRLKLMIESGIDIIISDKSNFNHFTANDIVNKQRVKFFLVNNMFLNNNLLWFVNKPVIQYCPEDKIYIYFTSGTTGTPKAIVGKNNGLLHFINWEINTFGIYVTFRISQFTTPGFDAFLRDVFVPLCSGGVICIPESKDIILDPHGLIHWIDRSDINLIHCVPSLFRSFNSCTLTKNRFRNLKFILLSGEKIYPSDLVSWYETFNDQIKLVNLWGTSETTLAKTYYSIKKSDINRVRIPVGKPIKGARVIVLDENIRLCNELEIGELYIATPFRTFGYYNDIRSNKDRFIQNPFNNDPGDFLHKTGDLGRLLPDGNLEVLGRTDRQVKIRGIRIELEEIESLLIAHRAVKEAVVIKKEMSNSNELLCAYIVENQQNVMEETSLISNLTGYLFDNLPDFMVPDKIIKIEQIPLNPNGKVDYDRLPDPYEYKKDFIAPSNEIEKRLLEIWSEVLRTKEIGINNNFFEFGGNSLNAMSLVLKIHKNFNIKISLGEVFRTTTIAKQAELIKDEAKKDKYLGIKAVEEKEFYGLSSAQKRLYILHQMDENSTAYNMPRVVVLEGDLHKKKLEDTFSNLIERHESFRKFFIMMDNEPVQRVLKNLEFEIKYFGTEHITQSAGRKEERHAPGSVRYASIIKNFIRPFDLSHAPLLRLGLIKENREQHILMVDMHHIISDGVSHSILIQDIASFYKGEQLSPLRLQYKDFSEWQNKALEFWEVKKQGEYWQDRFKGEIPVVDIPTDYQRPPVQRFEGADWLVEIDEQLASKVRQIAIENETTLYTVLLTVCTILLSKYSGQSDIIIGTPIAGRRHVDLDNIVGMFVNVLLMRNDANPEKRFEEFLMEVKNNVLQAFDNQDYQFDKLVEDLDVKRDRSRNMLYDVVFAMENLEKIDFEIPNLKLRSYTYQRETSKTDLRFGAFEINGTINIRLTYSTSLFKQETAEEMARHYMDILKQVTEDNRIKLKNIRLSHDLVMFKPRVSRDVGDFEF